MSYVITEIDGVIVENDHRFPVNIQYSPHAINGSAHIGVLDDGQIPLNIMRTDQHQSDPHTMTIDGRDVSIDGDKLDTIEPGAQVNNLTNQQAQSLTSGMNSNWHTHDDRYFTKSQLQAAGSAQVNWGNITNVPSTFPPSSHTHPNDSTIGGPYYTQVQLQTSGQSQVNWDNLTNKPTFGGNNWLLPVESMYAGSAAPTMTDGFIIDDRVIWSSGSGSNQHIYTLTSEAISDQLVTPINGIPVSATSLNQIGFTCSNNDYTISSGVISSNIINSTLNSSSFNVAASLHCPFEVSFDFKFTNMNSRGEYSKFTLNVGSLIFEYKAKLVADPGNKYIALDGGFGPVQFTNYWTTDQTWYNIKIEVSSTGIANVYYDSVLVITTSTSNLFFNELMFWFHGGNKDGVIQGVQFRNIIVSGSSIIGTWADTYTPILNDCVIVQNDGDGRAAQYWFNGTIWIKISDVDWGNHGSLSGLLNDDHPQYLNVDRHNAIIGNPHQTTISATISSDSLATFSTNQLNTLTNGSEGSSLHNHDARYYLKTTIDSKFSNYYTSLQLDNGQLDNRYYTKTLLDNGQLDNRYYTQSLIDSNFYTRLQLNSGQLDNRYYTISQIESTSGASYVGLTTIAGLTATNVQKALEALNTKVGSIVVTLNSAYHNGSGILADAGPVVIDTGSTFTAPLELTNKTSAPISSLAAGQIAVINNVLYVYDGIRAKWLSPSKTVTFGKTGNSDGNVLRLTGEVSDENSGYKMIRNGTITGLTINSTAGVAKNIDIRLNGSTIYTLTTDVGGKYLNPNLNLDYVAGDVVSLKVQPSGGGIQNTAAVLEFCHRG